MSRPIENDLVAKEFWENLGNAAPLDDATKALIIALLSLTTGIRIYNTTTGTYYNLTLTGTLGAEYLTWTPE